MTTTARLFANVRSDVLPTSILNTIIRVNLMNSSLIFIRPSNASYESTLSGLTFEFPETVYNDLHIEDILTKMIQILESSSDEFDQAREMDDKLETFISIIQLGEDQSYLDVFIESHLIARLARLQFGLRVQYVSPPRKSSRP